jgi:hypothetical protein
VGGDGGGRERFPAPGVQDAEHVARFCALLKLGFENYSCHDSC